VATQPPLISIEHSTVDDSALPENEPTDADGEYPIDKSIKRVTIIARRSENNSSSKSGLIPSAPFEKRHRGFQPDREKLIPIERLLRKIGCFNFRETCGESTERE